ncbi:MAG: cell wall-binding repeat-containing protein, partial [Acidimicrobiales bacterium]
MRKSPLWFRRLLVGGVSTLTVGGLGFAGLLTAGAAGATSAFSITQLAGADRFGTAAVIAEKAFPSGAPTVVIASGANANLSDSLAASYLAAQENAGKGAPILLVNPTGAIPSSTVSALNLLKPTKIVIVGGTGAVGSDVETALANSYGAGNVTRVAGPNRFATADAVDSQTGLMTVGKTATPGGHPAGPVAIVADGLDQNLVDALGASPLAYAGPYPLFLVNGATGTLSSTDLAIMATDGIKNAVLVGGSAAIGSQVASDLTVAGITSEQEAGPDRSATSDTLAEFELDTANKFGFVNTSFDIASGDQGHLVDSLSGGPLGGAAKAPTLITDGVDSVGSVATFATTHNATEASATQFGGTDAVSATVATSITQAAKGQAGM